MPLNYRFEINFNNKVIKNETGKKNLSKYVIDFTNDTEKTEKKKFNYNPVTDSSLG